MMIYNWLEFMLLKIELISPVAGAYKQNDKCFNMDLSKHVLIKFYLGNFDKTIPTTCNRIFEIRTIILSSEINFTPRFTMNHCFKIAQMM